jgi:ATP-binding cassette subfamily C protein LapB
MELPVERSAEKRFLHRPMFKENIEFHNVSFQYPNQEVYALQDVSFKINIGEKVAIIGPMGSGKSTIERLLLSLYSPTEGAIFIDGVDITQIDPADLRRNIGYVSQDFSLLYGTVHSNISLSVPWANDQAILQAAKLANVDHFVSQHPAGYAMPIGEQGAGLSGGQRQSIAIARAILSNPPILLLDEPTSSIDLAAEKTIINNLSQFSAQKTLLLITHKMPMLALADRVIILSEGKIIANGPKKEVFASMQNTMAKKEDEHG